MVAPAMLDLKTYLVGGAVRDTQLGLPITDRDWVVVGANAERLNQLGFQSVGKDFPVFLHPDTKEEYALARLERKAGAGYHGFAFDCNATVTLEQDLQRRDLTINAIAQDPDGHIIDPYHGMADLQARILRHVSPAFAEDPVRILRLTRFAARFAALGFKVAPETLTLCKAMVASGEVDALVAERVWQEWHKALGETSPFVFYQVLLDCDALSHIAPECMVFADKETAQACAAAMLRIDNDLPACASMRFAVSCLYLTKEQRISLCQRLRVSKADSQLVQACANYFVCYQSLNVPTAASIVLGFELADAYRQPDRYRALLQVCFAVSGAHQEMHGILLRALQGCQQIDAEILVAQGLQGEQIGKALRELRLQSVEHFLQELKQ